MEKNTNFNTLSSCTEEANEIYQKYVHFCDECPKAHDFTCSGADSLRCDKEKSKLVDGFFKLYDRRIICVVMNEGVLRSAINTEHSTFENLDIEGFIKKYYTNHKRYEGDEFRFLRCNEANRLRQETRGYR